VNSRRLVMFKLFQEVRELRGSRSILSARGLKFVTDEIPEQAVVSSFFFRPLNFFCSHVIALCCRPQIETARNYHAGRALQLKRARFDLPNYQSQSRPINNLTLRPIRHTPRFWATCKGIKQGIADARCNYGRLPRTKGAYPDLP